MSSQAFQSIIARLQQRQISADEAGQLLRRLKADSQDVAQEGRGERPAVAEEIAVIGMAGQFPGAADVERFWHNLSTGVDGVGELGERYLDQRRAFSAERQSGKTYCKWGGILEQRDDFDPLFFNISPRDAESMNPHQRLVLQESWKALEDAGYNPKGLRDQAVGIFVGAEPAGYFHETFIGASDAIIASRLSYYLDFKGPALVVNTGCSSSATAIHLACESLRNGESTLALAGGVFATLGEPGLISLAQMDMLSPTGRCHTFDQRSDGIVLSEAVGMLALKRLSEALADGDPIHGVICASGMNQDGASNGITAPSGQAQERLIGELYRRHGIDPRQISYVEAHGTGTPLGDPVEVNALVRAFRQFTSDTGYCALGSAKAHIGHASAAAGVVSLIKILLSMKHRQLPGLLHFQQLNPRIELAGSAFHIHREPREWPADGPRMAALNSFGHSGTNVHMVIRQAPQTLAAPTEEPGPLCLLPLSARTADSLRRYARRLRQALLDPDLRLADLAYTLQVGRQALAHRLMFLCGDKEQLRQQLNHWLDRRACRHCWDGQVVSGERRDIPLPVAGDPASLQALAEAWVAGGSLDWAAFNRQHHSTARRIHAPVYPFARQNFWIPPAQRGAAAGEAGAGIAAPLHPFLERDTSDPQRQRFTRRFDGQEWFLAQHRVAGQRIFPGVAHLEMARAAVALVAPGRQPSLSQVVWLRPLIVEDRPRQVEVELTAEDDGQLRFEISSRELDPATGQAMGQALLHSQGLANFAAPAAPQLADLAAFKARMNGGQLDAGQCYQAYQAMTFDHGPAYQGLQRVYLGHGEVLAQLALPACQQASLGDYVLHPSLLDSALQAAIALSLGADVVLDEEQRQQLPALSRPTLPFALEALQVLDRCSERMWARVSYAERRGDQQAETALQRLDIQLFDEQGKLCVALRGFTSRVLNPVDEPVDGATALPQTLLFQPRWLDEPAPAAAAPEFEQRLVLLSGFEPESAGQVQRQLDGQGVGGQCRVLDFIEQDCALDYERTALALLQQIRGLLGAGGGRRLLQLAVHDPHGERLVGGLAALLRSLQLEVPAVRAQLLELDEPQCLAQRLADNAPASDVAIRYQGGRRQVLHWLPCPPMDLAIEAPWRDRGVYLITGGLGGLGRVFAQAIVASVSDAVLILTGRSPATADATAGIDPRRNRIEYRQLDVSDEPAVRRLVAEIVAEHRHLDGVLHCAGVIQDSLLVNKQDEQFRQVLAAKVAGTRHLDLATADLALDFWIGFSSGTGVVGNVGQADYAAANAFVDRYAAYRQRLVAQGLRQGHSLAINWPLWKDGGMRVDAATARQMQQDTGMLAMPSNAGIHALRQCVALALPQVLVMHGQPGPIIRLVGGAPRPAAPPPGSAGVVPAVPGLGQALQRALIEQVSAQMKIPASDIRTDAEFSQYGFDSISLTTLANSLKQQWRLSLAPTIFFEHATIGRFAAYLEREHHDVLAARFAPRSEAPQEQALEQPRPTVTPRPAAPPPATTAAGAALDDIAIIGVSGCFPMAEDVAQFCRNLQDGRDCISEVPASRWDWREYYGDPHREPNKTNVKWGGFIHGVDHFDPLFFAISPREAQLMDPQQRLLMTHVWLAIEDAGYAARDLAGSDTGIFVGTGVTGYSSLIAKAGVPVEGYSATAMVPSVGPNRMSFLLDFHGPSEPIETACSSSLVAIHRAVQAIRSGDCAMAIAGGVNTLVAPEAQISFSKAGMLALDGRSKTFSAQANGYARGEGVGMIVLKTRAQAEADGDPIYALIRGTAQNHGGKANSLTAPNPRAQAELLKSTYRKAGVDPRSIGYIEAHGTGTELGDPIEINGLKMAFRELADELGGEQPGQGYCGVGSVKSNIGHLELAAGIAGVIKVLLQLKHKTLFKSLHCESLNPYIELDGSPFYVVQHSRPWAACKDRDGNELPRRAGISSFGFGGANAHILLEEYRAPQPLHSEASPGPRAFLLSARTEDQLRESARRLAQFIASVPSQAAGDVQGYLDALAYTLQVGREPMAQRLALLSDSLADLQRQLDTFVASGKAPYRGLATGDNPALALFGQDDDMAAALTAWIAKRKYHKLLELWVQGLALDWRQFYREGRPMRRLNLPGYPFAGERYWVTDLACTPGSGQSVTGAWLHPLLERNTSDFSRQRFSSRWRGDEPWFADHRVAGQSTMPGVAYLEMARAAMVRALDPQVLDGGTLQLRNVAWLAPYGPTPQANELHVELNLEQERIEFRIYSQVGAVVQEHCQGSAQVVTASQAPALDLDRLRADGWTRSIEAGELYTRFAALGIDYGPSHRGVSRLWLGEGRVLAQLELAQQWFEGDWLLHPGMLDCAVQASIGLLQGPEGEGETLLPFAVEQVQVHGRCQPRMWALVSLDKRAGSAVQRIEIQLCDAQGHVAVTLRGFSSRPLGKAREPVAALAGSPALPAGLSLLAPRWSACTARPGPIQALPTLVMGASEGHRQWLSGLYPGFECIAEQSGDIEELAAQLAACRPFQRLVWVAPAQQATLMLFRLIKALLQSQVAQQALQLQLVFSASVTLHAAEPLLPELAACHGLAGSLAKEQEQWRVELVDLPSDDQALPQALLEPQVPGQCLAWRDGQWFEQRLLPLADSPEPGAGTVHYREGGVYVVIGGAGGIGEAWSRHLISHWRARVVWLGRRAADQQIEDQLEQLAQLALQHDAAPPLYLQADATDPEQLVRASRQVAEACGPINGWVHSALVLDDARLAQMDEARFRAVFDAKRLSCIALAAACGAADNPALDFVLFFSSMNAFSRAAGQGNYAAGCAFADAFAAQLGQQLACAVKVMNWGYWGSVGVVADPAYRARMSAQGLGSIEPPEGMAALDRLLASPLAQLGLIKLLRPMAITGIDSQWQLACYPARPALVRESWSEVAHGAGAAPQHHAAAGEMNRLLLAHIFACLGELAGGGPLTEQRIAAAPAVAANLLAQPFYRRWLRESLRLLVQNADIDEQGHLLSPLPEPAALRRQWQQASQPWRGDADLQAQLHLVQACMEALPAILRGEQAATAVMFPDGSMSLVEGVYQNNRICDYFNAVLGQVVADVAQRQAASGQALRILEIGAGTGGTTATLIEALRPWQQGIEEYCYSDISQAFLRHAQVHFAPRAPYLRTAIFDVDKPCAEQGIDPQRYDLVIATNVLHATADLRRTLQNAKSALRQGGLLVLNEISDRSLFTHLTFGLLEGWWLHNDTALRIPGCPGLYPERWRHLLQAQGFERIAFPAAPSHGLGQQIIVAASDGVACLPVAVEWAPAVVAAPVAADTEPMASDDQLLAGQCRQWVTQVVSQLVDMAPERLQRDMAFDRYGIDSILQISLIQALEKTTGELSRTLLFEHNTIDQLASYLMAEHRPALAARFAAALTAATPPMTAPAAPTVRAPLASRLRGPVAGAQLAGPAEPEVHGRDIAIIGVGGRYPLATDLEAFWDNLRNGRNCVSAAEGQRWPTPDGQVQGHYGGFLEQVTAFDHQAFGIDEAQARHFSPPLRQMLEVAWLTFENAGYNRDALMRLQQEPGAAVGVFIGSMYNQPAVGQESAELAAIAANVTDWQLPNRISHHFDLKGPSLAVNTACASSMSAIHLACQSILQGECAMALAGGVNLILDPSRYQTLKQANLLGTSTLSRGFGLSDGMLPGEGAGAVLLKPLATALADGERILGVIKGSALNHGGGKLQYSAPNTRQQTSVIAEALRRSGLQPAQIDYIEAAANGSELGDPIEVAALKKVFGELPPGSCALGTVKSNIGHLEAASGISQLTKVLLQLQHRQWAPTINAEPLNPHIRLEGSPLRLQLEGGPWEPGANGQPRRCLINSFGAGGAYASLVVEEYRDARAQRERTVGEQLLIIAAASRTSLMLYLHKLQALVEEHPTIEIADLAYSLALREHRLAHRAALVVQDRAQLLAGLESLLAGLPAGDCWLSASTGIEAGEPPLAAGSLRQAAAAWCHGAGLDIPARYPRGGNRIALPGYAFEHPLPASEPGTTSSALFSGELYRRISGGEMDIAQFTQLLTRSTSEQGML